MKTSRFIALALAVLMTVALLAGCSSAPASSNTPANNAPEGNATSNWPSDTVSFYVPAKAGGGSDIMGRAFIQGLSEYNNGNYIVVNDVTGGGSVAAETVRNAKPDGLNLLMYHTGLCSAIASGQYAHTLEDFTICGLFITPVTDVATGAIFVPGNSPFNTLEELITYAQAHPGELLSGVQMGSSSEMTEALIESALGFETSMVEAGSNADKVTALMGNQIDMAYMGATGNDQYVKSGDLKCLAVLGAAGCQRSPLIPDASTIEELGYEAIPMLDMIGFIAGPKGMSEADVAEINKTIKAACENETVIAAYDKMSAKCAYYSIEDAEALLAQAQANYDAAYALING